MLGSRTEQQAPVQRALYDTSRVRPLAEVDSWIECGAAEARVQGCWGVAPGTPPPPPPAEQNPSCGISSASATGYSDHAATLGPVQIDTISDVHVLWLKPSMMLYRRDGVQLEWLAVQVEDGQAPATQAVQALSCKKQTILGGGNEGALNVAKLHVHQTVKWPPASAERLRRRPPGGWWQRRCCLAAGRLCLGRTSWHPGCCSVVCTQALPGILSCGLVDDFGRLLSF